MILKNRIIAAAGILPYIEVDEKGQLQILAKRKTWENLASFDGVKQVPIIDGHPKSGRVRDHPEIPIHGYAEVHICKKGGELLCADLNINDNAPKRKGYSIGFIHTDAPSKEVGVDADQILSEIDHIALEDLPRQPIATNVMSDTLIGKDGGNNGNSEIIKYKLGYDSFRNLEGEKQLSITPEQLKELETLREFKAKHETEKVLGDKFGIEIKSKEELLKKKDEEFNAIKTEYDSLKLKLAEKEKAEKEAELAEVSNKATDIIETGKKVGGDSMGAKAADMLKGQSPDFIKGMHAGMEFALEFPRSGATVEKTGQDAMNAGSGKKQFKSTADYKITGYDKDGKPIWG
jgi:hypothetical protein